MTDTSTGLPFLLGVAALAAVLGALSCSDSREISEEKRKAAGSEANPIARGNPTSAPGSLERENQPRITSETGRAAPLAPGPSDEDRGNVLGFEEASRKFNEWTDKMNNVVFAPLCNPPPFSLREKAEAWRAIVEEAENLKFTGEQEKTRTIFLAYMERLRKPIREAVEAGFEEECRRVLVDIRELDESGKRGELLPRYRDLFWHMHFMDRVPPRAQDRFRDCTAIYLGNLRRLIREDSAFAAAIAEVESLLKAIPPAWSGNASIENLVKEAESCLDEGRSKAESRSSR